MKANRRQQKHNLNQKHLTRSILGAILFTLVSITIFAKHADAQATLHNYCGSRQCIESFLSSCDKLLDTYEFQGSCCSMEDIPSTGGCRITVSIGNCYWYPFCGSCEGKAREDDKCHNIYETDAGLACPVADYDPVKIQSDPSWVRPSCAPTTAPSEQPSFGASSAMVNDRTRHTMGGAAFLAAVLGTVAVAT